MSILYLLDHYVQKPLLGDDRSQVTTLWDTLKIQDADMLKELIGTCLDVMENEHEVDVSDVREALDDIEITREYTVDMTATVVIRATIEATSEDDARDKVNELSTWDILCEDAENRFYWEDTSHEIEDVYPNE